MEIIERENRIACPSPDISAYIDGELSPNAELDLEQHISACRVCADDLNLQKSFLNVLDHSLEEESRIELPKDFTKSVVANAESRVSGLRRPGERRNAAFICAALVAFSLFALGSNAERTFVATGAVFDKVLAVIASVGHVSYDIALGVAIVFRTLASKFLFDSGVPALFVGAIVITSLYLFSRVLTRLRRT